MPSRHKHVRQKFEHASQCAALQSYEHYFRHEVQAQLEARAAYRRTKQAAAKTCTDEELATGIEQLQMTDSLRGQLAKIQRVRRAMKLEATTPVGIACGQ